MDPWWMILLGGLCGVLLIYPILYLLLCICGCTCRGIRGGSIAACCQSKDHPLESGGLISNMQSMGAGGQQSCCPFLFILLLGGAIGAGIGYCLSTLDL
ncbi:UNVERIFIED_CONTAM: hypothetical protein RMT77_011461 [Armadillidium vulgare]